MGMDTPSLDLYAVEEIDEGVRIYRSDDAVFEAWTVDNPEAARSVPLRERGPNVFRDAMEKAEARLYRDDGRWYAKVRFRETDVEEAYDRLIEAAQDVNATYATALDISPKRFRERVHADGMVTLEEGRTTLHYREETDLDTIVEGILGGEIGDSSLAKGLLTGGAACVGIGAAAGAGIGAAIGSLAGPPGVVGGAALGAQVGGINAGGGFFLGNGIPAVMAHRRDPNYFWRYGSGMPVDRATKYFEERRQEKQYTAVDAVEEHLSAVNRLHSLAEEVQVTREMEMGQHEELEALRDRGIEEVHEGLMQIHFGRFEDGEGVTAVHAADSYEEAVDFLETVGADAVDGGERPSLYRDMDAFTTVFDHLAYTEQGGTKYLNDACTLGRNVQEGEDVQTELADWIRRQHPATARAVGLYPVNVVRRVDEE